MQIFAPRITSGLARDSSAAEYQELFAPENKETLLKFSEDAEGNVMFDQKRLTEDAICVNFVGAVDSNTTARVVLPYPIVIPKLFTKSFGVSALKPSASKTITVSVAGRGIGTVQVGADGAMTFAGPADNVLVQAHAEIALNFDALVGSGGGDITMSLYILK